MVRPLCADDRISPVSPDVVDRRTICDYSCSTFPKDYAVVSRSTITRQCVHWPHVHTLIYLRTTTIKSVRLLNGRYLIYMDGHNYNEARCLLFTTSTSPMTFVYGSSRSHRIRYQEQTGMIATHESVVHLSTLKIPSMKWDFPQTESEECCVVSQRTFIYSLKQLQSNGDVHPCRMI